MELLWNWKHLTSTGPKTAFSCFCVIKNQLYVHGGVNEARSVNSLNSIHRFALESCTWTALNTDGSPCLSHHACVSVDDRYILLIGGWNGRERSSKVYVYDCEENIWITVDSSGFPPGAGLSSHTASSLQSADVLIIGREGSLRTQRRSGNAFLLSGSVKKRQFVYKEYPLGVASRSGHTSSMLGSTLCVIGGRSDKLLEIHRIPGNKVQSECTKPEELQSVIDRLQPLSKVPGGRKNHSATTVGHNVLIYGGETFDGRNKEPVRDLYILEVNKQLSWKHVRTDRGLAGHACVVIDNRIIVHGGIGERNLVTDGTYVLCVK